MLSLFHNELQPDEYCDRIAKNYKEKLPLMFEKCDFLKSQLGGILLYENFDFLIYEKARFMIAAYSVWNEWNREFYDDKPLLPMREITYLYYMELEG
ncbi:MAG: hypothetical protein WBE68_01865 [Candidatus Nitrosopolaris sp.]